MTDSPKSLRRIAANVIQTTTGTIEQGIVVIEDGIVVQTYPFSEEEAMTEWIPGTIILRLDNEGKYRAYKGDQLLK
jgi:hypothetical protein